MPSSSAATSATSARSTRSSRSAIMLVLLLEPVDHRRRAAASLRRRCGKTLRSSSVWWLVTDAAVGLAERAERPVVLADRHAVDERAHGGGVGVAGRDLLDEVAQLVELGAQVVVDVDQVPAGGLLRRACSCAPGRARGPVGPRRLVPRALVAEPARRRPGVGVDGERRRRRRGRRGAGARLAAAAAARRRRPARARRARPPRRSAAGRRREATGEDVRAHPVRRA